ncbi:hypothetical protein [Pseudactinotalea suaedae]|uniref:8-oxoguanine DNA glycosylase OGG fold protein n=1 Tax=Pseudactinotalea suaedae TaxID=1524924 RepID=UPI0012E27E12|nr:hypothetical protein [Pseudactinotalea suaedae]
MTTTPAPLATRLANAPEPQRAFSFDLARWRAVLEDLPAVDATVRELPRQLEREAVRRVVHDRLAAGEVLSAFIPVMIWGGPGGYGASRTRSILTGRRSKAQVTAPVDPTVADRLEAAVIKLRRDGPVQAFFLLNNQGRIPYLRGAFFTKWLYFASAANSLDGEGVAPILDKRVRDWIRNNTDGRPDLSPYNTTDYEAYIELLTHWGTGAPSPRTPAQVELEIFELSRA